MSWSLPLKLWKLFHAINFGWTEDSSLAAGGNNQRLTSPSWNPLRLAKHAANDRSNFHYCKTFIYELWSTDLVRKQTLFFICRCQSTQIFETVKARNKSLNCPWLPPLFKLWPLVNYLVYFTISPLRNQYEWERVLDQVWEDGLCKIHSMKFSKLCFCLACSKLCFCLAPAKRKVVPPQLRGPSPPLPLRNFGPLTFHPNTL